MSELGRRTFADVQIRSALPLSTGRSMTAHYAKISDDGIERRPDAAPVCQKTSVHRVWKIGLLDICEVELGRRQVSRPLRSPFEIGNSTLTDSDFVIDCPS